MQIVQHPLYSGHSDDYMDENDSTPLMFCVGPSNDQTVPIVAELVYNQGADPNFVNKLGYNAMSFARMWAAQGECTQEVLDVLIAHGADPNELPVGRGQGPHKPSRAK